ncbi:MAG: Zn-ribbon domain-containing OB-fold protein [Candidatus Methanofastidiosia archaeon]
MDVPRHWRENVKRYRLLGTKCKKCGAIHYPQRTVCNKCKNRSLEVFQFKGTGKVYSYTIIRNPPQGYEFCKPYAAAFIELDEGELVTAQLTDCDVENVEIGMPVELVTRKLYEYGKDGIIIYGYKFRPILPRK